MKWPWRRKPKRQHDWRVVGYGGAGWCLTRCATCGKEDIA